MIVFIVAGFVAFSILLWTQVTLIDPWREVRRLDKVLNHSRARIKLLEFIIANGLESEFYDVVSNRSMKTHELISTLEALKSRS